MVWNYLAVSYSYFNFWYLDRVSLWKPSFVVIGKTLFCCCIIRLSFFHSFYFFTTKKRDLSLEFATIARLERSGNYPVGGDRYAGCCKAITKRCMGNWGFSIICRSPDDCH